MRQIAAEIAEELTVKRLRLKPTVASGQLDGDPADGKTEALRVEIKTTLGLTLRIDIGWLRQIEEDAVSHGQVPVLSFQFIRPDSQPRQAWVAVPERFWETIREALERGRI